MLSSSARGISRPRMLLSAIAIFTIWAILPSSDKGLPTQSPLFSRSPHHVQRDGDCVPTIQSDLYGIGVRIGFYLQTLGTFALLVIQSKTGEMPNVSWDTLWFHTALLAVTIHETLRATLYPSEVYIVLNLLWILTAGEYYISATVIDSGNVEHFVYTFFMPQAYALALWTIMTGFSMWFWIYGLNTLRPNLCGTDGVDRAFIFLDTTLIAGYFQRVSIVLNAIACLGLAVFFLTAICHGPSFYQKYREKMGERELDDLDGNGRVHLVRTLSGPESKTTSRNILALWAFWFLLFLYCLLSVELSIKFNGFQSANTREMFVSIGQLLPFIIGLGTAIKGTVAVGKYLWYKAERNSK